MSRGALQSTGNPLDVAIQGDGLLPRRRQRAADRHADRRTRPHVEYTRAGNFTTNSDGLPGHPGRLLRLGHAPAGGADRRVADPDPARRDRTSRSARTATVSYVDRHGHPRDGRLSSRSPRSPTRPASSAPAGNRWLQSANSGTPTSRHPGRRSSASRHRGAIEMSNVDLAADVHEHDHRAARLPGQLARDQHRRRDAAGSGEPEALDVTSPAGRAWGAARPEGETLLRTAADSRPFALSRRGHLAESPGRDPSPPPRASRRGLSTSTRT